MIYLRERTTKRGREVLEICRACDNEVYLRICGRNGRLDEDQRDLARRLVLDVNQACQPKTTRLDCTKVKG